MCRFGVLFVYEYVCVCVCMCALVVDGLVVLYGIYGMLMCLGVCYSFLFV